MSSLSVRLHSNTLILVQAPDYHNFPSETLPEVVPSSEWVQDIRRKIEGSDRHAAERTFWYDYDRHGEMSAVLSRVIELTRMIAEDITPCFTLFVKFTSTTENGSWSHHRG